MDGLSVDLLRAARGCLVSVVVVTIAYCLPHSGHTHTFKKKAMAGRKRKVALFLSADLEGEEMGGCDPSR